MGSFSDFVDPMCLLFLKSHRESRDVHSETFSPTNLFVLWETWYLEEKFEQLVFIGRLLWMVRDRVFWKWCSRLDFTRVQWSVRKTPRLTRSIPFSLYKVELLRTDAFEFPKYRTQLHKWTYSQCHKAPIVEGAYHQSQFFHWKLWHRIIRTFPAHKTLRS